jgi:hypothetical protein
MFVFVSGKMFRVASGTATDVTPSSGVSISDSATTIYGVSYDDQLIISDGVNRPWKVTSALSATPLTGAYLTDADGAWFGPPQVYYGKLFGIRAAARSTIEWSEENDPDDGYDVNRWQLTQTDADALFALHATNDALYYFRAASIGGIRGAVTTDFQNDGVQDGVDNTLGTMSPASVVSAGRYIYFVDRTGRPHRFTGGGSVQPIWHAAAEILGVGVTAGVEHLTHGTFDPESRCVIFGHTTTESTALTSLVFDGESGRFYGSWLYPSSFNTSQFRGMGSAIYQLATSSPTLTWLDQLGNLWQQMPRSIGSYSDNGGSALDIAHTLTIAPMGYDPESFKQFDRLAVNVRSASNGTNHTHAASYRVPASSAYSSEQSVTKAGTTEGVSQKVEWGVNAEGRWFQPKVTNTSQLQLGYLDAVVEAYEVDAPAGAN